MGLERSPLINGAGHLGKIDTYCVLKGVGLESPVIVLALSRAHWLSQTGRGILIYF
jgi:hypothetical protein